MDLHTASRRLALLASLSLAACTSVVAGGGGSGGSGSGGMGASAGGGGADAGVGAGGAASGSGGGVADGGVADGGASSSSSSGSVPPPVTACGRVGVDPGAADPFARLTYGFTGAWTGVATAPAAWLPASWPVAMTFRPDGTYSAHNLAGTGSALYYVSLSII